MRKTVLVIVAVLAVVAAVAFALKGGGKAPENGIVVSGNIELVEVSIGFKTAGRLVERTVNEGEPVKRGQVVARLDREQLDAQKGREGAALAAAQAQLAQAKTTVDFQRATLAADIEQRRAEASAAAARLEEMQTGARPQERRDAKASVDAAAAEADRAQRDYERARVLHDKDDISTQDLDQARTRKESAEAALRSAKEKLALVEAGPRTEQIAAQKATVEKARAAVKMAEANAIDLKRREQEVTSRMAEIGRAKASLTLIETQLSDTVAISPVDGVVLVKSADPGEILPAGATVLTVGDIDHPWLRGYINETDLGRVKVGSKAKVTTDSYPGKVYNGTVTFISSEAEFTPKQIQTKQERVKLVYRVKITVENPARELKSNMPADAEILLEP